MVYHLGKEEGYFKGYTTTNQINTNNFMNYDQLWIDYWKIPLNFLPIFNLPTKIRMLRINGHDPHSLLFLFLYFWLLTNLNTQN